MNAVNAEIAQISAPDQILCSLCTERLWADLCQIAQVLILIRSDTTSPNQIAPPDHT